MRTSLGKSGARYRIEENAEATAHTPRWCSGRGGVVRFDGWAATAPNPREPPFPRVRFSLFALIGRRRPFPAADPPSAANGGASGATALLGALGDRLFEPTGVDGGVDRGGADVGVTGELADHCGVGAGVGQVRAEGVA
jgi:hypothetical protein